MTTVPATMAATTIRLSIPASKEQQAFCNATEPTVVFQGGAGSGKTWAGVYKAMVLALTHGGSRGMFVAPSFPQMQQAVIPHLMSIAGRFDLLRRWKWNRQQNLIQLPNGSSMWLRSADNPTALLGADLAWCVGDEVGLWKKQAYDFLIGRLRQPGYPHQAAFTFTPKGLNWCHEVLGVPRAGLRVIRATTLLNPFLDTGYYDRLIREYGKDTQLWRQEVLGEYVAWEGLIYPQFSVDTHIIEPPADIVTAVGGVDWGWTNPGVMLVLGVAADGTFHVLHETYEREQPIEWWAAEAQRLTARYGVSEWHCDPSEPGNIRALKVAGVEAVAANNAVVPGIAAASARIASRELLLAPQCVETVRELQTYCWKTRPDGTQRKDEPEKHNDHAMDALRYAVMALTVVKRRGYVRSW